MTQALLSSTGTAAATAGASEAGCRRNSDASTPRFVSLGVRRIRGGRGFAGMESRNSSSTTRMPKIICQASEQEKIQGSRRNQIQATELFAELLKADDVRAVAQQNVESLSEDFFMIASTYLNLAKKEGNVEVVTKLESTLQTALSVKESTLRPEIRLLNQLLRQKDAKELSSTIQSNLEHLQPDSYFFQLLKRMISDVENQRQNPGRSQLLAQLRQISKETNEINKATRKSKGFGTG